MTEQIGIPAGSLPLTFPFLSLPLEIRNQIYENAIFPDAGPEIFIFNSRIQLALLQVSRVVSSEASRILYAKRIAVITFLPYQFYLNGRQTPMMRLFRDIHDGTKHKLEVEQALDRSSPGHIYPHILARFLRIRLCLFFPATFQIAYPLIFFNPIAELKSVLTVLRGHLSSSIEAIHGKPSLDIIVAVYPRTEDEEMETLREARVREDFVTRGITEDLKEIRAKRTLKVGGNFTREGLVRFCKVTCGD